MNETDYVRGAKNVKDETDQMTGATAKNNKGLSNAIALGNLKAKALQYVASHAIKATKAFIQFESTLRKTNTLMGKSTEELGKMGRELETVAMKTGVTAQQLAEGMYDALSAGVDPERITGFMEDMAKLSVAGFTDVSTAVDATTTVMNIYGDQVGEVNDVMDVLVATQNKGKTTVDELGRTLSNVLPTAESLGIQFHEVSGALALMTANGVKTSVATTQLRAMLAELGKEGSNADKVFQEIAGETFPEFIENGGDMTEAIQMMGDHSEKTGIRMANMFGSIEAGNSAMLLAKNNGEDLAEAIEGIADSSGTTDKAVEEMSDSIDFQLRRMTAGFSGLGSSIVRIFAGPIAKGVKVVADALESLNGVIDKDIEKREFEAKVTEEMNRIKSESEKTWMRSDLSYLAEYNVKLKESMDRRYQAIEDHKKKIVDLVDDDGDGDDGGGLGGLGGKTTDEAMERQRAFNTSQLELALEHTAKMTQAVEMGEEERSLLDLEHKRDQALRQQIFYEKLSENDERFKDQYLQSQMAFYEADRALYDAMSSTQEIADEEYHIRQKELSDLEKHEAEREKILKKSASVTGALQRQVLAGRVKSLSDMQKVIADEISAQMMGKAVEHGIMGMSDLGLGMSYLARPAMASMAPVAFKSSAENFALATAFGAGSAVAGSLGSSSGTSASEGTVTPTDPIDGGAQDEISEGSGDSGRTVIIQGVDWVIKPLEQALNNKYNVRLTAQPKGGYK
jgi:TP901 family phage tail tape measure protein